MIRNIVFSGRHHAPSKMVVKISQTGMLLCSNCLKRQLCLLGVKSSSVVRQQCRTFFTQSLLKQRILEKPPRPDAKTAPKAIPKISDIKKLMLLAKHEKYYLLGGITLLGISSAVTMSVPFFMGRIIDMVFKQDTSNLTTTELEQRNQRIDKVMKNLRTFCFGLIFVFTVGAIATFGRVYLMNFAGERVINRLRTSAFSSILKQEIAFFDKTKTGELINRLSNDVWTVGYATTMNISDGLRAFVGAVGGTSMMFYVSPKLAVLGLGIVPPVAAIAIVYGRYVRNITRQMNDALAESTEIAEERISSIRTVRAFTAETKEERSYIRKIDQVLDIAKRESIAKGLFFGFNTLSGNLIMLALLYNGGNLVTSNVITIGELSSFLLYALYVGVSMAGISGFYTELMHGVGASGRLFELVERKPKIPLSGGKVIDDFKGNIEFKNVHFSYPTRKEAPILKGVNLVVPAGTTLAIVGSSGSGKSTLAALLLRLYDTKGSGTILMDGVNIKELDPHWLRNHIGTVSQEPVLFSCSIKDNIAYGAENVDQVSIHDVEEAAQQANAYEFVKGFPEGFNTILGERGQTLSGGQKQRIAIARALLKKPKILLMDEATSALDSESEHLVREALDTLMHDTERTVIIIAHRLSTILNADQIAVLADGKVVELGTYWQLMSIENGIFRKLVERQTVSLLEEEEEVGEAEEEEEVEESQQEKVEKETSSVKI